jgi:hypothetical protein
MNKFIELLEIRNLIALLIAIVFVALALMGKVEQKDVMVIVTLVFGFFFGNKATKDKMD